MKNNKLVSILFAIASVLFLVPAAKSVITGQPLDTVFLVLGIAFLVISLALGVALGKSGNAQGPPGA